MSSGTEGGAEGEATARALGLGVLGAAAVAALGTARIHAADGEASLP